MASIGRRTNGYKLSLKKCRLQITTESVGIKIKQALEQPLAETLGAKKQQLQFSIGSVHEKRII